MDASARFQGCQIDRQLAYVKFYNIDREGIAVGASCRRQYDKNIFFFHSSFYLLSSLSDLLSFISALTGFPDRGLVTRWARLLITLQTVTYPAHRKIEER